MKKFILLSILSFVSFHIHAQNKIPTGVTVIGQPSNKTSFLLKDQTGTLWCGLGAINANQMRYNAGLTKYVNGAWQTVYSSGNFTDALEINSTIYFANYSGMYEYTNGQMSIDNSITSATSLALYNQKLMVGTFGKGLYEKTTTGYNQISISINGIQYDSIYCLFADKNELWIGTTNGLVKYDGTTFSQYSLPFKKTYNKNIINNLKAVNSIVKDANGKVWVVNNNLEDSLDCLYFLENGSFTRAKDYYANLCTSKILLPYSAKKLTLTQQGTVMIGMGWGLLELTNDNIIGRQMSDNNTGFSYYKTSAYYNFAYCDSDGYLYTYVYPYGLSKVNLKTFSNDIITKNGNGTLAVIDINDIKTTVSNVGINTPLEANLNPTLNLPTFQTPSIGCASAMWASAIWMGGLEEGSGDLHLAAETYRQRGIDFKPGPIDLVTMTYDSTANSFYNKIWKINRQTIDDFIANRTQPFYVIPKEILEWPAHGKGNFTKNLAPFVDVDKNGLYEPLKGDYPKIKGDQMLWWVFNDLGAHTETGGLPIGVEVHGSCYAYFYKDLPITDSNHIINRTLFFNYKIINRSTQNYNNFNIGIWCDPDLGNYSDDYVGCHVTQNAGYVYNGDNNDEGEYGYGLNPPHLFCKLLNQKMDGFLYYNNNFDPVNGNPNTTQDFYNYMDGKWQNGNNITFGGNGIGGNMNTKYMYDAKTNPTTNNQPCWNEFSAGNSPADRRFLMSTQAPVFKSDSIFDIEFAFILDTNPINDICNIDMTLPSKIQNWYNQKKFPSRPYYGTNINNTKILNNDFSIYPNPSNGWIQIKTDVNAKDLIGIEVIDNSGKSIYNKMNDEESGLFETSIDLSGVASGIYLIKLHTNAGVLLGKVVKQ